MTPAERASKLPDCIRLSELILKLQAFRTKHGDLPCVHEKYGALRPRVIVLHGKKACDLHALPAEPPLFRPATFAVQGKP